VGCRSPDVGKTATLALCGEEALLAEECTIEVAKRLSVMRRDSSRRPSRGGDQPGPA
jgi:hypothetical protein